MKENIEVYEHFCMWTGDALKDIFSDKVKNLDFIPNACVDEDGKTLVIPDKTHFIVPVFDLSVYSEKEEYLDKLFEKKLNTICSMFKKYDVEMRPYGEGKFPPSKSSDEKLNLKWWKFKQISICGYYEGETKEII